MPCPLCKDSDNPLIRDSCERCYPEFMKAKLARRMPESIINSDGLRNHGFNAWRQGKCQERRALERGVDEAEAEKIGFTAMEAAAKRERDGITRQQARIAQERAITDRLFRRN